MTPPTRRCCNGPRAPSSTWCSTGSAHLFFNYGPVSVGAVQFEAVGDALPPVPWDRARIAWVHELAHALFAFEAERTVGSLQSSPPDFRRGGVPYTVMERQRTDLSAAERQVLG